LKNGVTVKIRAVRLADKAGIADAFGRLDSESVYTRFFQAKKSLSDQELRRPRKLILKTWLRWW